MQEQDGSRIIAISFAAWIWETSMRKTTFDEITFSVPFVDEDKDRSLTLFVIFSIVTLRAAVSSRQAKKTVFPSS